MEQIVSVYIYLDGGPEEPFGIPMSFQEAQVLIDEVDNSNSTMFITAHGTDGSQLTFVPRRVGAIYIVKGEEA